MTLADIKGLLLTSYELTTEALELSENISHEDRQAVLASLERTYEKSMEALKEYEGKEVSAKMLKVIETATEATATVWGHIRTSLLSA